MRRRLLVGIMALVVGGFWMGPTVWAQEPTSERPRRVLLIDRIDELGRTIFDGILSPFQQNNRKEPSDQSSSEDSRPPRYANRSSLVRAHTDTLREPADVAAESTAGTNARSDGVQGGSGGYESVPIGSRKPLFGGSTRQASPTSGERNPTALSNAYPREFPLGGSSPDTSPARVMRDSQETDSQEAVDAASKRLDQRLMFWQESPFEDFPRPGADAGVSSTTAEAQRAADGEPAGAADREEASSKSEDSGGRKPTLADPVVESPRSDTSPREPTLASPAAKSAAAASPAAPSRYGEDLPAAPAMSADRPPMGGSTPAIGKPDVFSNASVLSQPATRRRPSTDRTQ